MNNSNSIAGKSLPIQSNHSPSAPSGPATSSFDTARRPNSSGSNFHQAVPRHGQGSRKQHRNQKRPQLGERDMLDEDDTMAEVRALRNPSSRRGQTSITHLLNYSTPMHYQGHAQQSRSYRRHPTWGPGSGHHSVDKARYVHANYRFIVSSEASYDAQSADADVFLEWSHVMQVIASSESQMASCPICLSEPVAPRMAKCGHIFCLPCIIRFMNSTLNDDEAKPGKVVKFRKCPICEDSIYLQEMRPARFYAGQESPLPRPGDDVVLRLMARNADSTLALPREGGSEVLNSGIDIPWHFAANVLDYSRIMKGTREYMAAQFDEEIEAMLKQAKEDELLFGQDAEWTQKAIRTVTAAKEKLETQVSIEDANAIQNGTLPRQHSSHDFYFYSTLPHLYLSPLDIRILKTKFGSFSAFPSTLLPRVEHISTGHTVDDAMRRRAKYLGHLPHGCVVSFLECDWTDIVSADILENFATDIEKRRSRNRDKAAQEERERLQSERLEAATLRSTFMSSRRAPSPIQEDTVPSLNMSEFQPLTSPSGTTPPNARPGFSSLASMSTSPSTSRTVWGTHVVASDADVAHELPDGPVNDGWLKEEDIFATDIAAQIEALSVKEPGDGEQVHSTANRGGGKKKKKQKITLMSTGGQRGF